ncbi:MAG: hypothetical protein IJ564_00025, partial [Alphaproteobacteria bacterium]|nr:hypothetical protein [Alphaproteobacteria bacterium]
VAEFKQAMKKLTANEKDAVVIGLRDELTNRLGSAYNENVTNKKFLVDNVRQKIKAAIDEKRGNAVIDEFEQAYKLNQNAGKHTGGSQTAEKTGLREKLRGLRRLVHNPWDTTIDAILAPFDNTRNIRTAEALTNRELPSIYNQMRLRQIVSQAQPQRINWLPYLLAAEQTIGANQ